MGFLLGKSNAASLTEFEVTGQDVKFSNDKNTNRSINRSLQAYMFREKGSFGYDFDYMTEADYRLMLGILQNRNSLREGMQLLPIPYSETSASCLLRVGHDVPNEAFKISMSSDPANGQLDESVHPPTIGGVATTEFSVPEYNKVSVYDTNSVSVAA